MNFSKQAATPVQNQHSGASNSNPEAWSEWNKYQFECFKAKEQSLPNGKLRKTKTLIGKVNFIMDLGFPKAKDSEWDTKCALPSGDEQYSAEEQEWMKNNPSHNFIWTTQWDDDLKKNVRVRKQTSPSYPQQEFGIAVDFPQIMIDYSKHPNSTSDVEELRPMRISLNGSFHSDYYKTITFDGSYKQVSDRNLIVQICQAAGKGQELVNSGYDIGVAAGAVCNFTVKLDLQEKEGQFKMFSAASKPAPVDDFENPATGDVVSAQDQIDAVMNKEGIQPFVGILLNKIEGYDYTDQMLDMLGRDTYGYVKRASTSKEFTISGVSKKTGNDYSFTKGLNFEDSDFAKVWVARGNAENNAPQQAPVAQQPVTNTQPSVVQNEAPVNVQKVSQPTYNEPQLELDDRIPF